MRNKAILVKTTDDHEHEWQSRYAVVPLTGEHVQYIQACAAKALPGERFDYRFQVAFMVADYRPDEVNPEEAPQDYPEALMLLARQDPGADFIALPAAMSEVLGGPTKEVDELNSACHLVDGYAQGIAVEYWGEKFRFHAKALDQLGFRICVITTAWMPLDTLSGIEG